MHQPALIVVSGSPGSGKTTLARLLADQIGCPLVSRDEIKQGMALAFEGYEPGLADQLAEPANLAFFDVLARLVAADVSLVAEAAFQDHLFRPPLERLSRSAAIRIIQCHADAATRRARLQERVERGEAIRSAHADRAGLQASPPGSTPEFVPIELAVPRLDVDTSDGYDPDLAAIFAFAS